MLVGYPTSLVEGGHQDVCSTSSPTVQAAVKALEPETDRQTDSKRTLWSCHVMSSPRQLKRMPEKVWWQRDLESEAQAMGSDTRHG